MIASLAIIYSTFLPRRLSLPGCIASGTKLGAHRGEPVDGAADADADADAAEKK